MVPWREAWTAALYGSDGFFVRSRPAQHFRTAVTASDVFAEAMLALLRREGLDTLIDVGAGGGELLVRIHTLDPALTLVGVDLAPRPPGLPDAVAWLDRLPDRVTGLLLAHEWLDDVPCDVVEVDENGVYRLVLVDPTTGEERLGEPHTSTWLQRWWPPARPGNRAEDGSTRDDAWADAVSRVDGVALAIDYGHVRSARPPFGTLRSYAGGREVDVRPDGSRDVTAHVAADSLADRVGARVMTQRQALTDLGVEGRRPDLALATTDPAVYVRALARATDAAELVARDGWGDFLWVWVDTRGVEH